MRSRTLLRLLLFGTICALAVLGADNSLGTWRLNVAKSTYSPAPLPVRSLTSTRAAWNGGVKVTNTGELTDGSPINSGYTAKYDGTESPVTGTVWDTILVKQVDADAFTTETKKTGGTYHATGQVKVSGDGKTMTVTSKGTNAEGKPFTASYVYEKQ